MATPRLPMSKGKAKSLQESGGIILAQTGILVSELTSTLVNKANPFLKIFHKNKRKTNIQSTSLHLVLKAISIFLLVSGIQHFFMTGK